MNDHYQILVMGDTNVGKTSLVYRFTRGKFIKGYNPTYESEIHIRRFRVNLLMEFRDTPGYEKFLDTDIESANYSRVDGAIIMFSATDYSSCTSISYWLNRVKMYNNEIPCIVLANKIDLLNNNPRSSLSTTLLNTPYFRCSVKTGEGLVESANHLIMAIKRIRNR